MSLMELADSMMNMSAGSMERTKREPTEEERNRFGREPNEIYSYLDGVQMIFEFENGFQASVIRHRGSYGSKSGLWELAVRDKEGKLTYETPITNDVLGYLTDEDVKTHLSDIEALPEE